MRIKLLLLCTFLITWTQPLLGQKETAADTWAKIEKSLVPRHLDITITVKGSGSYNPYPHQTITWKVDRTYTATAQLNKVITTEPERGFIPLVSAFGYVLKDLLLDYARPRNVYWSYDHSVRFQAGRDSIPGGDRGYGQVETKVNINDSWIREIYHQPKSTTENAKVNVKKVLLTCTDPVTVMNLSQVILRADAGTLELRPAFGGIYLMHGFGANPKPDPKCVELTTETGVLTPPDPPDVRHVLIAPPPIPAPKGKFPSLVGITIPLGDRDPASAARTFQFDTGDLVPASISGFLGPTDQVKVRAVYKFR